MYVLSQFCFLAINQVSYSDQYVSSKFLYDLGEYGPFAVVIVVQIYILCFAHISDLSRSYSPL